MSPSPLKRHPALHHLSHDHHHGLLLCWKIRQGFKFGVGPERIKAYCEWFWNHHLEVHFREEEDLLFPILGVHNLQIKQAMSEHRKLKKPLYKMGKYRKKSGTNRRRTGAAYPI